MHWMLMPLKRYADFSGRSRRMEYWMWQVFKFLVFISFLILASAIFGIAFASLGGTQDPTQLIAVGGSVLLLYLLYLLFFLAILIPDIAVGVRRLHDTNRSGWWLLAPLGSYLIGIILMVVTVAVGAGTGGPDQMSTGLVAAGGIVGLISGLATLGLVITLIVFMFLDGTPGPNRYGPDPKGRDASAIFA
jgi:uncharacterized membrane protein YhaH (DUF805 family)